MRILESRRSISPIVWQLPILILIVILGGWALAPIADRVSPVLALGALFGLLFLIFFLQRPDLGFLLVLFIRGFSDSSLGPRGASIGAGEVQLLNPNVGLILILIFAGGLYIINRRIPFISLPAGNMLILLQLTGFIGIMGSSESLVSSLYEWVRAFSVVVVYALSAHLFRSPQRVQRVIDVLAVTFVVPALVGFYQAVTHSGYRESAIITRISGTFVWSNAFGVFLVLFLSVFLCQALVQSGTRKLVALAIVAASGFLLISTYARASWVGALVVFLTVGVVSRRAVVLAVPIAAILIGSMIPTIATRSADPLGGSFADRQDIWQKTIPEWLQATNDPESSFGTMLHRLVGAGPGTIGFLTLRARGVAYAAHDDYLLILAEYGILGLMAFLAISVVLVLMAYRTWRHSTDKVMAAVPLSLLATVSAYLVMGVTDNVFAATQNQVYLWTLAGLTVAIRQMSSNHAIQTRPDDEERLGRKALPTHRSVARRSRSSTTLRA